MNDLQIRCFVETAKCLNFSKAASNLYISQPTLSRNILKLEKELGVKLFTRNSFQGTALTSAGICMLNAFMEMHEIFDASLIHAHNVSLNEKHTLSIGMLEGQMMNEKLNDILVSFTQKFPNVQIKMSKNSFYELSQGIKNGDFDFIITLEAETDSVKGLKIMPLYSLPTLLAVPNILLKKVKKKKSYKLSDFKDLTFICINKEKTPVLTPLFEKLCVKAGFIPNIEYVANLQEETLLIEMGIGIAGLNLHHSVFHSPNVRGIEIPELIPQRFSIVLNPKSNNEAVKIFTRFYSNYSKTHEYDD